MLSLLVALLGKSVVELRQNKEMFLERGIYVAHDTARKGTVRSECPQTARRCRLRSLKHHASGRFRSLPRHH